MNAAGQPPAAIATPTNRRYPTGYSNKCRPRVPFCPDNPTAENPGIQFSGCVRVGSSSRTNVSPCQHATEPSADALDSAIDRSSGSGLSGYTPKGSSSRRHQKRRRGDRHTSLRARSPTLIARRTRPSDQGETWAEARSFDVSAMRSRDVKTFAHKKAQLPALVRASSHNASDFLHQGWRCRLLSHERGRDCYRPARCHQFQPRRSVWKPAS